MNRYYTFLIAADGKEEMGMSHYDLDSMCRSIEMFLSHDQKHPERDFLFVAACKEDESGEIQEVVRWKRGSSQPIVDNR